MRRKIPTGTVYQRNYRDRNGKRQKTATWFLKYYVKGKAKPVRVSSGTENREEAIRMLRQRMAKAAKHAEYSEQVECVLVDQLLDLVLEDYRFNKRSSTYDLEHRLEKHLRPFFGHKKAVDVTTPAIKKYTCVWQLYLGSPAISVQIQGER